MQVQRMATAEELDQLQADWNCLTRGVPFRRWEWLQAWWRAFQSPGELCVLAVRDEAGTLVGVAPWYLEHRRGDGGTLRLLGSGEVCSDYLTLLATPEHEEDVVTHIGSWLLTETCWDQLHLEGVPAEDPLWKRLLAFLRDRGCSVHQQPAQHCWRVPLPASWEQYLKDLPKPKRTKLRSAMRRFLDQGLGEVRWYRSREEISEGMAILVDLHQRRRQSLGQPGCFASECFSSFLHEAVNRFAALGQVEVPVLFRGSQPIAADLVFSSSGVQYVYQGGMDPEALDESPGRILTGAMIRSAIEQGLEAFDFLRGDEPYKREWDAEPVPLVDARVAPPRTWPQLRHRVWVAGVTMKDWIRDGMTLMGVKS